MLKKLAILGLLLIIAGALLFKWNLAESEKEQQELAAWKAQYGSEADQYLEKYNEWLKLSPEERENSPFTLNESGDNTIKHNPLSQHGRLKADIDKLATGEADALPFGDILYGDNWQEKLNQYKKRQEKREFILTGSIVCVSTGSAMFGFALFVSILKLIASQIRSIRVFIRKLAKRIHSYQKLHAQEQKSKQVQVQQQESEAQTCSHDMNQHQEKIKNNYSTPLTSADYSTPSVPENKKISLLLSDCRSDMTSDSPTIGIEQPLVDLSQLSNSRKSTNVALETNPIEDAFKSQAEILEKQLAEVREMTQDVRQSTLENSKPLNSALTELTQQVSAIREYAAYQQERVEKLQDGYDWNIIRTFCLRVIRCIDNLETRIERLSNNDTDTAQLEEVRDELIFALESSGVEQFTPEINSDYRGQEKCAEAIKDKEHSDTQEMTGKIAKVIRPGYQYFINEENIKVVRTAQVKLFG